MSLQTPTIIRVLPRKLCREAKKESTPHRGRLRSVLCFVCLTMKPVGEPDAGNPHVRFDERGWETERCRVAQAPADRAGALVDCFPAHAALRREGEAWDATTAGCGLIPAHPLVAVAVDVPVARLAVQVQAKSAPSVPIRHGPQDRSYPPRLVSLPLRRA